MVIDSLKFDLLTQRFLAHRWQTPTGKQVRETLLHAIHASEDLTEILQPYVLSHPANIEPHRFPYYPIDAMAEDAFWVLTADDLRGIHFVDEDFSASHSLERKHLTYAQFEECQFVGSDLHRSDLSYASFEGCDLSSIMLAHSGGVGVRFWNCNLTDACLFDCAFIESNFSGCDLRGAYLEQAFLRDIRVDYLTRFDIKLRDEWKERSLIPSQLPDLYRAIRIAYERADLSNIADRYLYRERRALRRHVIWPLAMRDRQFWPWARDLIWSVVGGYGTRPSRLIVLGMGVSLIYALIYFLVGGPEPRTNLSGEFASTLYFSFTTFATLGYGDISYGPEHPLLRLVSTSEAWVGAVIIALFVAVMARKMLR